jgi:hypothetical protein
MYMLHETLHENRVAALLQTCVEHTTHLSNWDSKMVMDLVNCDEEVLW